tara:strand:+ start:680 stop:1930 length:1251 start_codon:yes stop_codon:yes gene_type:complete
MTEEELIKKLNSYADDPYFGAMTNEKLEAGWTKVASAIGANPKMEQVHYTWQDYAQYGVFLFRENMVRPMAVGFATLAVLLGGWTGMVGASFDAVPGDVLYPVKIANEKAQLSLAFSGERKVKLHAEFASRRLDEVVAISASDHPEKEEQVKVAMNNFTREVEAVSQQIEELKADDLEGAAELVMILDRKVEEYETVIEQSKGDIGEEVAVVEGVVENADTQVVEVLVENQEVNQEEESAEDLQKKFQKDYAEINQRLNLSVGRIASIEDILYEYYLEGEADYYSAVDQGEDILRQIKPELHDAMDVMAVGGYRGAFEKIAEIYDQLDQVETDLAAIEIEITTQISALAVEEENEAEAEGNDTRKGVTPEDNAVTGVSSDEIDLELTDEGEAVSDSELTPVSDTPETDASSVSELD